MILEAEKIIRTWLLRRLISLIIAPNVYVMFRYLGYHSNIDSSLLPASNGRLNTVQVKLSLSGLRAILGYFFSTAGMP